jgi:hypothetical protein
MKVPGEHGVHTDLLVGLKYPPLHGLVKSRLTEHNFPDGQEEHILVDPSCTITLPSGHPEQDAFKIVFPVISAMNVKLYALEKLPFTQLHVCLPGSFEMVY